MNLCSTQSATVNASALVDNQSVSTMGIITPGAAILNITSTTLNNSANQPLNINYTLPLNNSVTWLSVLWKNTGIFSNELQIIVNGTVVESKRFFNKAYYNLQTSYREAVFNAILYVNKNLPRVSSDPNVIANFWNSTAVTYNLTSTELEFVQNHRLDFIDNLTVNLDYPGVAGQNITVTDPENSSNVINLNFPGNFIHRTSQIIYVDGIYGDAAGYEGVRSFAIATTKVTSDLLTHWMNQGSLYQQGAMKAAYGTFLAALMVEYVHDMVADNVTSQLNVTWSRTSPIIVSAGDEAYQTYLTLECDHSMGITVVGTPENMISFNYVCSSTISSIEYWVMNNLGFNYQSNSVFNGSVGSVMNDLHDMFLNGTPPKVFKQNGLIIMKAMGRDDLVMVIDPENGIVRDINTVNGYCGAYCYHDPQTDMVFNFGEAIIQRVQNFDWKKSLETYYHDIISSQSDLEKEQPANFMGSSITPDGNFMIFGYGGAEGDDTWLHYKVVRTPPNNDCWVIECSVVYYVGDKSYRETQYAVLLPGKSISILYEGDHHTFKFKIHKNEQWGIIETHTIAYYCFQKM